MGMRAFLAAAKPTGGARDMLDSNTFAFVVFSVGLAIGLEKLVGWEREEAIELCKWLVAWYTGKESVGKIAEARARSKPKRERGGDSTVVNVGPEAVQMAMSGGSGEAAAKAIADSARRVERGRGGRGLLAAIALAALLIGALGAAVFCSSSCAGQGVDQLQRQLHIELQAWPEDLRDFAARPGTDPERAESWRRLATEIEAAHALYHEAAQGMGSTDSVAQAVSAALTLADSIVASYGVEVPDWLETAILFTKATLRRIDLHLETSRDEEESLPEPTEEPGPSYVEALEALEEAPVEP